MPVHEEVLANYLEKRMERQTGATTQQMQEAPPGAVFVWCNEHLHYPRALAKQLGRADLEIVGPGWLESDRWYGRTLSGLVTDHALAFSARQWQGVNAALLRVRQNAKVSGPDGAAG